MSSRVAWAGGRRVYRNRLVCLCSLEKEEGDPFPPLCLCRKKMPKNNLHPPVKSFVAVKCCQSFQQIYISKSECECSVNRKPFNHLKYSASPTERKMILLLSIAFEKLKNWQI